MVNPSSNVSYLFQGRFFKCAESKGQIVDKQSGEVTEYYTVMLTNGIKTFHVTCGITSDLVVKCDLFKPYQMFIDVVESRGVQKLKVVAVEGFESSKPDKH